MPRPLVPMSSLTVHPFPTSITPFEGIEWVVEAGGCDPDKLRDQSAVVSVCEWVISELQLMYVGDPLWYRFPGPGGVTGLYLLAESHLACHTYPEHGFATFNLYCCRPRPRCSWERYLRDDLGAKTVQVRELLRTIPPSEPEGGR